MGLDVGQRRVGRLKRQDGIQVVGSRKFKRTTDSDHTFNVAPNHLQQGVTVRRPNQKRAGAMTYVRAREGPVCMAVILVPSSRRVVGWATGNRMKHSGPRLEITRGLRTAGRLT